MGFSENLENNLKSLEASDERDSVQVARELARRESERKERLLAAPYAEQLRTSPFTQDLLAHSTRIGFSKRVKVHMAWIDSTLRLDARNLRVELVPTSQGVQAHYFTDGRETATEIVDLNTSAEGFANQWLSALG